MGGSGLHPAFAQPHVVEHALAADPTEPIAADARSQPIDWVFRDEKVFANSDSTTRPNPHHEPLASESAEPTSIQIVSVQSGRVVDTVPLVFDTDNFNFRGRSKTKLLPGVYQVQLVKEPPSRKWLGFLAWESVSRSDKKSLPKSWPLIVLPSSSTPPTPATKKTAGGGDAPRILIHWDGITDESSAIDGGLLAIEDSTERSRMIESALAPLTWIRGDESSNPGLVAQAWAMRLARIDQRVARIAELAPDGVLLDATAQEHQPNANLSPNLQQRYVIAKCNEIGLPVWHIASDARSKSQTPGEINALAIVDSESTRHQVADYRRPPVTTLLSRFRPDTIDTTDAEFIWFGMKDADSAAPTTSSPSLAPSPLANAEDGFEVKSWLNDWSHWTACSPMADQAGSIAGLIVDEHLISNAALPEHGSVEEAVLAWRHLWIGDSQWLESTSEDRLVFVRQCRQASRSTFVCFNHAPWSMTMTLPLAKPVQWTGQSQPEATTGSDGAPTVATALSSLRLTRPIVSTLGSTVLIPPMGMVVCQTEQEVSRSLTFGQGIHGGAAKVAEVTRDVTTIVERLGLLGELASLTRIPTEHIAAENAASTELRDRINPIADTQAGLSEPSQSANRNSSIWSADRWGFARAVTNKESIDAKLAGARSDIKNATEQGVSEVSTATEQLGVGGHSSGSDSLRTTRPALLTCRNLLTNGGFEAESSLGIPGWMHSQHPVGSVALDRRTQYAGSTAVRLAAKDSRGSTTWLISRDLYPPETGRLGVSLAFRGGTWQADSIEPKRTNSGQAGNTHESRSSADAPSVIRVAIEGERNGHPIRQAANLDISPDGQWHSGTIALQWLELDPQRDTNLRLTIDNFSSSVVWIDDVVVTDYFASHAERTELQSLAYLAVNGLQHSDLAPAAKLLNHFWASELLRVAPHTPVTMTLGYNELAEDPTSKANDSSVNQRGKSLFESPSLPRSVWAAPSQNPTIAPPASTHSGSAVKDNIPTQPAAADAGETVSEEPTSISQRIRGWLPSPLRF